jgi:hypothetical protein
VSGNEDAAHRAIYNDQPPEPSQLPYATVLEWLLALLGAPVIAVRLRKSDRAAAAILLFCWITAVYAFVATSLFEFGENERFRFELGNPPLIAGVVVSVAIVRWSTRHSTQRRKLSRSGSGGFLVELNEGSKGDRHQAIVRSGVEDPHFYGEGSPPTSR